MEEGNHVSYQAIDEKGRKHPFEMHDREILVEILQSQRRVEDTVSALIESMKSNPMLRGMMGRING
jgi:hypothetical protein